MAPTGTMYYHLCCTHPYLGSYVTLTLEDLYRVMEDGTHTQYRLAAIESLLPPHSEGPVFHFHEMHDEGFYVTVITFLP